jgi:hypothetical protein
VPELDLPAAGSRLGRLIRTAGTRGAAREGTACELCGAAIPEEHRHLLELDGGRVRCVCRPCSLLFDRSGAGGERYRRIPDRVRRVEGFRLDDARWQDLAVPVGLAYFFRSSLEERVAAFYPGPMGATESRLGLEAWDALEADNPVLGGLEPDVEALLVLRAGAAREHWLVPIDACYRLVAVLRTHWQGLSGGSEAWRAVGAFFAGLGRRARPVDRHGRPARRAAPSEA